MMSVAACTSTPAPTLIAPAQVTKAIESENLASTQTAQLAAGLVTQAQGAAIKGDNNLQIVSLFDVFRIRQAQTTSSLGASLGAFMSAQAVEASAASEVVEACSGARAQSGAQCAYALAYTHIGDGLRASRAFGDALENKNWASAEASASAFNQVVTQSWPQYEAELENVAGAEQDSTPYRDMKLFSLCDLHRREAPGALISTPRTETMSARIAYQMAIGAGLDDLGIAVDGGSCSADPSGADCGVDRELVIGQTCRELEQRHGVLPRYSGAN